MIAMQVNCLHSYHPREGRSRKYRDDAQGAGRSRRQVIAGLCPPATRDRGGRPDPEEAAERARAIVARSKVTAGDVLDVIASVREARS